jgi:hypothetical protein
MTGWQDVITRSILVCAFTVTSIRVTFTPRIVIYLQTWSFGFEDYPMILYACVNLQSTLSIHGKNSTKQQTP